MLLDSGCLNSWKNGTVGETWLAQYDCMKSQAEQAPQTWVPEQPMITSIPCPKGSVLLTLRWTVMYCSPPWAVRWGVTSWTHKCHAGSKASWSTVNLPVQRKPKWAMVRAAHKTCFAGILYRGQASASSSYVKANFQDTVLDWIWMAWRPLCSQTTLLSGSDRPMLMCSTLTPCRYLRIIPCWRPLASARKVAKHKSVSWSTGTGRRPY